jgi:hypothetical protein
MSAAEEFGEVRYIFADSREMFCPEALADMAREVLAEATAADYLLLAGPQIMNIVVFDVLRAKLGHVQLLMFHARDNNYRIKNYEPRR